jgi:hypothetical protein
LLIDADHGTWRLAPQGPVTARSRRHRPATRPWLEPAPDGVVAIADGEARDAPLAGTAAATR